MVTSVANPISRIVRCSTGTRLSSKCWGTYIFRTACLGAPMPSRARRSAPNQLPRQRAGVVGVIHGDNTVYQYRRRLAGGVLMRVVIGGALCKFGRIENRHVGGVARLQEPAIGEAERTRREAGHLPDRARQIDELQVATIMAEDAREGAVEARMRPSLPGRAVRRDAIPVRADRDMRRADHRLDIVFRNRIDQYAR